MEQIETVAIKEKIIRTLQIIRNIKLLATKKKGLRQAENEMMLGLKGFLQSETNNVLWNDFLNTSFSKFCFLVNILSMKHGYINLANLERKDICLHSVLFNCQIIPIMSYCFIPNI